MVMTEETHWEQNSKWMANPIFDKESIKLVVVFLFPLGTEEKSSDLSAYKRKAPMGGLLGKVTLNIASFWIWNQPDRI